MIAFITFVTSRSPDRLLSFYQIIYKKYTFFADRGKKFEYFFIYLFYLSDFLILYGVLLKIIDSK